MPRLKGLDLPTPQPTVNYELLGYPFKFSGINKAVFNGKFISGNEKGIRNACSAINRTASVRSKYFLYLLWLGKELTLAKKKLNEENILDVETIKEHIYYSKHPAIIDSRQNRFNDAMYVAWNIILDDALLVLRTYINYFLRTTDLATFYSKEMDFRKQLKDL